MEAIKKNCKELNTLVEYWELKLFALPKDTISDFTNKQNRNIKQILGHMVDSVSNNTHRIIHLQYQPSPCHFPDYANLGNNDKWISIQNFEEENWNNLVQLWKYLHLHFIHVVKNIDASKLANVWISALDEEITLKAMVLDFNRHFKLHINEIIDVLADQD